MVQLCIDCEFSGISGDLMVSALASLIGIDSMKAYLSKMLNALKKNNEFSIDIIKKRSHGFEGLFLAISTPQRNESDHISLNFDDINNKDHQKHHQHSYRIEEMERDLDLALACFSAPENAKRLAKTIFNLILRAESQVHGIPFEEVHLHEIGAIDTILDISGTVFGLNQLGFFELGQKSKVLFTPVNVGSGTVHTAHGILPVPAPATVKILEECHIPYKKDALAVELATPTGVAILGGLIKEKYAELIQSNYVLVPERIGLGVGFKELPDRANILRLILGSEGQYGSHFGHTEPIFTIETNIDDVRGEILGNMIDVLISGGALDVNIIPSITKKNRPGHLISVVVHEKDVSRISELLIKETGTLGVRITPHRRISLSREVEEREVILNNRSFKVRIKISKNLENEVIQRKIEFDDLKSIAHSLQKSVRDIELEIWSQIVAWK
jgi:hypothetical protein